jgi:hypothetical protein
LSSAAVDRQPDSVFERFSQLGERDRIGGPGERVAALDPAVTGHEPVVAEFLKDVRHERPADAELLGDGPRRPRLLVQVRQYQEGVVGLAAEQCHDSSSRGFRNPHLGYTICNGVMVSGKCYFVETQSQAGKAASE